MPSPARKYPLRSFMVLNTLQGAGSIAALLLIPSEGGVSPARLALLALQLGLTILFAYLARQTFAPSSSKELPKKLSAALAGETSAAVFLFASTAFASLTAGGFYLWFYSDILTAYKGILLRFAPLVTWACLLAVELIVTIAVIDRGKGLFTPPLLLALLIIPASLPLYLKLVNQVWLYTIDDTYISLRYAQNLTSGWGLTFNNGLPRAEGYTTFLWVLLCAIPHLVGFSAVTFAKMVGVLSTLAFFGVTFLLVFELLSPLQRSVRLLAASVSVFTLAVYPPVAVHSVTGMETAFFTLLLTLLVYLSVKEMRSPNAVRAAVIPVVGLLLGLTRPEGNLFAVLSAVMLVGAAAKGDRRQYVLKFLLGYILPGAVYYLWRFSYYGLPFPLPFYVKTVNTNATTGLYAIHTFLLSFLPFLGVFLLVGLLKPNKQILLILSGVVLFLGFYIYPKHSLEDNWRYLMPVIPLIFGLAGRGIGLIFAALSDHVLPKKAAAAGYWLLVTVGICGLAGLTFTENLGQLVEAKTAYAQSLYRAHVRLGQALGDYPLEPGDNPVLVIGDAGAVPYYSRWETIDLLGLNEPALAQPDPPNVIEYIFEREPDLIVIVSEGRTESERGSTNRLYQASQEQGYQRAFVLRANDGYFLWLMTRPEDPLTPYLQETLEN